MAKTGRIGGSKWWRASEYEVLGGTHIVPAQNATIEIYDPFEAHREFWGGRRRKGEAVPPYVDLFNLDSSDPWAVADWCSRHGLLGVLPHRTLEVAFWPRWKATMLMHGGTFGVGPGLHGSAGYGVVADQSHYQQGFPISTVRHFPISMDGPHEERPLDEDELLRARQRPPSVIGEPAIVDPHVRVVDAATGTVRNVDLTSGYARFFPRVAGVTEWEAKQNWGLFPNDPHSRQPSSLLSPKESRELGRRLQSVDYPEPFSERFLREYGEPVHLFHRYANEIGALQGMWERARAAESADKARAELRMDSSGGPALPPSQLVGLRVSSPSAELVEASEERFKWEPTWEISSLYGALHVMLLQDITLRRALRKFCQKCGREFVTDNPRQKYCTDLCRNAAEQARRRARRKAEEES